MSNQILVYKLFFDKVARLESIEEIEQAFNSVRGQLETLSTSSIAGYFSKGQYKWNDFRNPEGITLEVGKNASMFKDKYLHHHFYCLLKGLIPQREDKGGFAKIPDTVPYINIQNFQRTTLKLLRSHNLDLRFIGLCANFSRRPAEIAIWLNGGYTSLVFDGTDEYSWSLHNPLKQKLDGYEERIAPIHSLYPFEVVSKALKGVQITTSSEPIKVNNELGSNRSVFSSLLPYGTTLDTFQKLRGGSAMVVSGVRAGDSPTLVEVSAQLAHWGKNGAISPSVISYFKYRISGTFDRLDPNTPTKEISPQDFLEAISKNAPKDFLPTPIFCLEEYPIADRKITFREWEELIKKHPISSDMYRTNQRMNRVNRALIASSLDI